MAESSTLLNTADHPAEDSLVDRKSEFIGDACHADTLAEALAFVDTIRERHPKARHVAYAAICGGQGQMTERMSDDGEPSGTAGKPILDVLRANGLTDCVVTVTRYFGGILLGSGGLTRAYSDGRSVFCKHNGVRFGMFHDFHCKFQVGKFLFGGLTFAYHRKIVVDLALIIILHKQSSHDFFHIVSVFGKGRVYGFKP